MTKRYHQAKFLTSAAKLTQLPKDSGFEVAFVGRSNAGKSSALNLLTQQKNLARTSKTPGRTQLLNFFTLDDERRLVDLPGYGFAKAPKQIQQHWQNLLCGYLEQRQCLRGIVLLMDIRHPLKEIDVVMMNWALQSALPIHILLTKADKLKAGAQRQTLKKVEQHLESQADSISVQLFSALKHLGLRQLQQKLDEWLAFDSTA